MFNTIPAQGGNQLRYYSGSSAGFYSAGATPPSARATTAPTWMALSSDPSSPRIQRAISLRRRESLRTAPQPLPLAAAAAPHRRRQQHHRAAAGSHSDAATSSYLPPSAWTSDEDALASEDDLGGILSSVGRRTRRRGAMTEVGDIWASETQFGPEEGDRSFAVGRFDLLYISSTSTRIPTYACVQTYMMGDPQSPPLRAAAESGVTCSPLTDVPAPDLACEARLRRCLLINVRAPKGGCNFLST